MNRHYTILDNRVELRERGPSGAAQPSRPRLEAFCPPVLAGRPVFMVLPGGGYLRHADHEGAPVARWLNTLAINAVVLHYSVAPDHPGGPLHPRPLREARAVLAWLRSGGSGLGVDPARIGVAGFSAGGHLAAMLSTGAGSEGPPGAAMDRPDLSVLAYPVISMVRGVHAGSVEALLGPDAALSTREALSADLAVDGATPPAFLWHTADDGAVPAENSLSYARALARAGIPRELHVFPTGRHGLGLAGEQPGASAWPELCARWLDGHHWL